MAFNEVLNQCFLMFWKKPSTNSKRLKCHSLSTRLRHRKTILLAIIAFARLGSSLGTGVGHAIRIRSVSTLSHIFHAILAMSPESYEKVVAL